MAYKAPFLRLVVLGTLYDTDVFSFSLSLRRTVVGPPPPDEVPEGIIDAVHAFWVSTANLISQHAVLQTLKLNEIGVDGKYTQDSTVLYDFDPPVQGSAGGNPAPQISLAISTATANARGRAHAGRFYLPAPATDPDATGMLPASRVAIYMSEAKVMLDAINAGISTHQLAVVSNLGAGYEHDITGIRVGRVLDTIRSRRSAFDEAYQSTDLA